MNRSILIVICDFLLLSLLTFSTDINRMADEDTAPPTRVVIATNEAPAAGQDLVDVMKRALEEQRHGQEQLEQQLAAAKLAANEQQAQMDRRQQENRQLQQYYATAQTNLENLNQQMQDAAARSRTLQQQLATTQAQAQQQSELAAALRLQLEQFARTNQMAQAEKQQLAHQLQLAEVRAQSAAQQAALMQQEVQAERAENVKLAEGFKTLATNSSRLTEEIRSSTPLAPNTIFSEFVSNQIAANIVASRSGLLGRNVTDSKETKTVLVTDGTNTFALCYVKDTPLKIWSPGTDWDSLTGTMTANSAQVPIRSLSFHKVDPRVVMMPVSPEDVARLGGKVYRISSDPYKFQDTVLVGADGNSYGGCNFQIDLDTPNYVKVDHSTLRALLGKFTSSSGDLVFSRTGELLGVMVNGTYCLMIRNFAPAATLQFGPDVSAQHTGSILSALYFEVFNMPLRLQ